MHPRERIEYRIQALRSAGLWREPDAGARAVGAPEWQVDARSNDYLGLARGDVSRETVGGWLGAGASRLIAGTHPEHLELEGRLAEWLGTEACLLFSSGYSANVGALAALAGPGETIFSDSLNHASIIDGCRLSRAEVVVLPHADAGALERALADSHGVRWVVTESYFGMDGDSPDLRQARALCDRFGAALVVDEVHALGVFGPGGRGLCAAHEVVPDVLVGGMGKAFGIHGGFVACSELFRGWLWNRARSFVFSTAPSPRWCAAGAQQLEKVQAGDAARARLAMLEARLERALRAQGVPLPPGRHGPIFPVVFGSEAAAMAAAAVLAERRIAAQPIRPPTVPPGSSRLRMSLRADLSEDDIDRVALALGEAWRRAQGSEVVSGIEDGCGTAGSAGGSAGCQVGGSEGMRAAPVPPNAPNTGATHPAAPRSVSGTRVRMGSRGGDRPAQGPRAAASWGQAAADEAALFDRQSGPVELADGESPSAPRGFVRGIGAPGRGSDESPIGAGREAAGVDRPEVGFDVGDAGLDRTGMTPGSVASVPATGLPGRGVERGAHRWVVLGTGTGVGKTFVARGLVAAVAELGAAVAGLKPIETGVAQGPSGSDACELAEHSFHVKQPSSHPLYSFEAPITPSRAAREAGTVIELSRILAWVEAVSADTPDAHLVIETAGGVFSPLSDKETNFELARILEPATWILVAPDRLGVIHDVTGCLRAMSALGRRPDLLVLSTPEHPDASTRTNAAELLRHTPNLPIIELPRHDPSPLQTLLAGIEPRS